MFFHFVHVTHVNIVVLTNEPRTQLNLFFEGGVDFPLLGSNRYNSLGHFGHLDWYMMHLGISVFDFPLTSECCSILL